MDIKKIPPISAEKSTVFNTYLTKNVIFLALISLLADFSSEMIIPLLPFFILELGGNGVIIGLISGLSNFVVSFLKVIFGFISDRIPNRTRLLFAGYGWPIIAKIGIAFSQSWIGVAIWRPLERVGKGIRSSPRDALLSDSVEPRYQGRAFGIHRSMDTTGAVLGVVVSLLLILFSDLSLKWIIFIGAMVGFLAILPVFGTREIRKLEKEETDKKEDTTYTADLKKEIFNAKYILVVISAVLFSMGTVSEFFFLLSGGTVEVNWFYSLVTDPTKQAIVLALFLYLIYNIVYALISFPAGKLADKVGMELTLLIGILLMLTTLLGFALWLNSSTVFLFIVIYGLAMGFIEGNQRALIGFLAKKRTKGAQFGIYHMLIGFAAIIGGYITGLFYDTNPMWTFIFGAICMVAAAIPLEILIRKHKNKN